METVTLSGKQQLIRFVASHAIRGYKENEPVILCTEDKKPIPPANLGEHIKRLNKEYSVFEDDNQYKVLTALGQIAKTTSLSLIGGQALLRLKGLQAPSARAIFGYGNLTLHPAIDRIITPDTASKAIKLREWERLNPANFDFIVGSLDRVKKVFDQRDLIYYVFEDPTRIRLTSQKITGGIDIDFVGSNDPKTTYNSPSTSLDGIRLKVNGNLDVSCPVEFRPEIFLINSKELVGKTFDLRKARVAFRFILQTLYEDAEGEKINWYLNQNEEKWIVEVLSWLITNRENHEVESTYMRFVDVVLNFQRFDPEIKNILLKIFKMNEIQKS